MGGTTATTTVPGLPGDFFARTRWAWHGLFAAVVVVAGVFLVVDGFAWGLALLALLSAAYTITYHGLGAAGPAASARPAGSRWRSTELPDIAYLALAYAVVGVLAWQDPNTLVLLFMVFPQTFLGLRLRNAIVATIVLTALYTTVLLAHEGWSPRALEIRGIGSVAGAVVAIGIGAFITGLVREGAQRAQLIEELRAARDQRDDAQRAADVAVERERLAREIHDTLAQDFTSVVMLTQAAQAALAAGDPEAATSRLAQIDGAAREGLAEARSLVASMQPPGLEGRTLEGALARLTERFAAETGVPVSFETQGSPGGRRSAGADVALLRAAQEALANVRRHAKATSVCVRLVLGASDATLEVVDDGHGFDSNVPSAGYGLPGMRARAQDVGGTATVESGSDGTTVRVTVGV